MISIEELELTKGKDLLVFLDDERNPSDVTWIEIPNRPVRRLVRTYQDFMDVVDRLQERGELSDVAFSFDHDIQCMMNSYDGRMVERTGYDCIQYLCMVCTEYEIKLPTEVTFHTQNPIGLANMASYYKFVKNYQKNGVRA
tara:strand:- start:460 stop:882 length:423 start_codon:yes stop_codon:yes gene_type:complete